MDKRIYLTFSCDQDWDEMKPSGSGRYCEACRCVVRDFTGMSVDAIRDRSKGEVNVCGRFSPEQLDPTLKSLHWPKSLKAALFTAGAVIGVDVTAMQAQDVPEKPKTEISHTLPSTQTDVIASAQTLTPPLPSTDQGKRVAKRSRKSYYYISRRFPFIHRAPLRIMGRYQS